MMHAAVTPVYNRLIRDAFAVERDTFDPWTFYPTGDLAESWENPEPTEYVFKLRQGVKWQNVEPVNGREFTADDVVYSLKRYQSVGLLKPEFELVDSIDATDKSTVRIRLRQPFADFLVSPLAKNQCLMLPHEIEDADGDFKQRAVGTGPFILTEYNKGVRVAFKRNPDYWGKDASGEQLPYLDEYEVLTGDATAQQNGFLSGQLDLTFHGLLGKAEADPFLQKKPESILYRWDTDVNVYNVSMQIKQPPFNDERVRRAFSMAIDWEAVNQVLFEGEGDNTLMFMPWSFVLDEKPTRGDLGKWLQHNPQEAKQMLSAAGYGDGFTAKVEYNQYQPYQTRMFEIIQQQLQEVGIQLEIQRVEYNVFFEKWSKKSYESLTLGFVPASAQSMDAWTYGSLHSSSPSNYWSVNDPEIDRLCEEQRAELDPEKRRELWKEIWDKELDQVWRLPTTESPRWFYANPNVHNAVTPSRYHNYFHYGGAGTALYWRS
jgi:peptide/nickel transport system substrate-binding protein